jgi:hypothetical protein
MDETNPSPGPATASPDRRGGVVRSVILMAGCAVMTLPIVLLDGAVVLKLLLAVTFLLLFTSVFVPLVWAEVLDSHESAARRPGEKRAIVDLIPLYAGIRRVLRPVLDQFSWWRPFRLGRFGEAIFLPDSTAIFVVCLLFLIAASSAMALSCISILGSQPSYFWLYLLPLLVPAVLVSPFALTAVLWVSPKEVRLVRVFTLIPYWIHRVPRDAEFKWELDYPVGFTSRSRAAYELQLGTPASASPLYHHICQVLERAGWRLSPVGFVPNMLRPASPAGVS